LIIAPKASYDDGLRVQALCILQIGAKGPEITAKTHFDKSTISRIKKKAISHGYDPTKDTRIFLRYIEDAPRVGRPKKATPELEEKVIQTISKNSTSRELSIDTIANMLSLLVKGGISGRTILRILRRRGYKPCKPTRKPGLTKENKLARLK
jgi:transposase